MTGSDSASEISPDLIAKATCWRRHLHQHPELAYKERGTAEFIAAQLDQFGLTVHRGLGVTGVVGVLRAGSSGRAIGLRADMDALPIQEETGLSYASCRPGIFHGCGHDGHIAMLLGAAGHLARTKRFDGTVYFIFQPAEEGHGGARAMIEDGLFSQFPADNVYALHNWPDLPVGTVATRSGPIMAASDRFEIVLEGRGGHAAMPHHTPDAILAASDLVNQLNTIVSRRIPPTEAALLSVTQIHGGHAHNVLPRKVAITGTVRTFDPGARDIIQTAVREIAQGVALGSGTKVKVDYDRYYPATINDAAAANLVLSAASAPGLSLTLVDAIPSMGSEDFAFMLQAVPGCYFWLGAARAEHNHALHSPQFDFNDELLHRGVALWVSLVQQRLSCA